MGNELADSNFKEIVLWLVRLRQRFRVTGASMFPLLVEGDEVLIDPQAYQKQLPQVGDIVVVWHPTEMDLKIVKRVTAVTDDNLIHLQSDNPDPSIHASDSRTFGPVEPAQIIGRVTCRF